MIAGAHGPQFTVFLAGGLRRDQALPIEVGHKGQQRQWHTNDDLQERQQQPGASVIGGEFKARRHDQPRQLRAVSSGE
jgi:hypothetical protein